MYEVPALIEQSEKNSRAPKGKQSKHGNGKVGRKVPKECVSIKAKNVWKRRRIFMRIFLPETFFGTSKRGIFTTSRSRFDGDSLASASAYAMGCIVGLRVMKIVELKSLWRS